MELDIDKAIEAAEKPKPVRKTAARKGKNESSKA